MGKRDKSKLKEKDTYKVFGHKVSLIPWDQVPFKGYKDEDNQNVVTIEASVVTGFECAALEEVKSKLKIDNVQEFMGRIGNVQLLTNFTYLVYIQVTQCRTPFNLTNFFVIFSGKFY